MATQSEMIRELRDFLTKSLGGDDLEMFLRLNDYEGVAADVNRNVSDSRYSYDVVRTLDARGLIGAEFFERLRRERPLKGGRIEELRELWLARDRTAPRRPGAGPDDASARAERYDVPPLHVYLIDRQREDAQIEQMLERLGNRAEPRPLVIVLHGDERHDHRGYINRLQEKILPAQISLLYGQERRVSSHELPLDPNMRSAQEVPGLLRSALRSRIRALDVDEIVRGLGRSSDLVLTISEINSAMLRRLGTAVIGRFLEFWAARAGAMTIGQWLIPCLLVAYEVKPTSGWRRFLPGGADEPARAYLRELGAGTPASRCPATIDLLVFDEPGAIVKTHANSWAAELAASCPYREPCLTGKLDELFAGLPGGSAFLRDLKTPLARILEECVRT